MKRRRPPQSTKTPLKRISVCMVQDEYAHLRDLARVRRRGIGELMRQAVAEFLTRELQPAEPPSPHAPSRRAYRKPFRD